MRPYFTILILLLSISATGQKRLDTLEVERGLTTLPKQVNETFIDDKILRTIEAVDKKYRQIADTLYYYKSLRHTIFQTVLIETNDSVTINPLLFGDKLKTKNIIFNNEYLNIKVENFSRGLNKTESKELFEYLKSCYDSFSIQEKKLNAQPVRIRYIKFPDDRLVHVGIDIYGTHFLWTIDRIKEWK
jgi:competence CoiA-like predicted nuclease